MGGETWGAVECYHTKCITRPMVMDGEEAVDDRGSEIYKRAAIRRWNERR